MLRTLPILEGLAPNHLAAIAQHAQERFFPRGTMLLPETDVARVVHFLVDGSVDVRYHNGRTEHRRAGDAVGFLEVLSRATDAYEARAARDTVALELDWEAQLDVCEEHFPVVMQYAAYLAKRTIAALAANPGTEERGALPVLASYSKMNLVERILVLHHSGTFSSGSFDALAELAHHVREIRWGRRKRIWQLGDPADHFVLLCSGTVRGMTADGTSFRRGAGATLGLHEAISQEPRWHAAVSESSATALLVDVEPFIDILEDHFDLALDFLGVLAARLIEQPPAAG